MLWIGFTCLFLGSSAHTEGLGCSHAPLPFFMGYHFYFSFLDTKPMPDSMFEGEGYVNIFSFDLVIEGSHLTNEKKITPKNPLQTSY